MGWSSKLGYFRLFGRGGFEHAIPNFVFTINEHFTSGMVSVELYSGFLLLFRQFDSTDLAQHLLYRNFVSMQKLL